MPGVSIDPDGDVLLMLPTPPPATSEAESNPDNTNGDSLQDSSSSERASSAQEVLVSSKVLSIASPVFKAMLNGQFSEAIALSTAKETPHKLPYRLPLPDDDAEAMTFLCKLLHFKIEDIPSLPGALELEKLAEVCDKYQCTPTLKYCGAIWIRNWVLHYATVIPEIDAVCRLLVFAYVADLELEFAEMAWILLLHHTGPFTGADSQTMVLVDHPLLHQNVVAHLDLRRSQFCDEYHKAAVTPLTIWKWGSLTQGCCRAAPGVAAYVEALRDEKLFLCDLQFSDHRFLELIKLAKRLKPIKMKDKCHFGRYCACLNDQNGDFWEPIQSAIEDIRCNQNWYGCLDCLRKRETMGHEKKCRIEHGNGVGAAR